MKILYFLSFYVIVRNIKEHSEKVISRPLRTYKMCIIFIYNGCKDESCDYALILVTNRDESFGRPSKSADFWEEDQNVIGGQDLQAGLQGGTWMALSKRKYKLGVLLNLPEIKIVSGKSRGPVVRNYVKSDATAEEYVELLKEDAKFTSGYIFLSVEFSKSNIKVQTYNNSNYLFQSWDDECEGFSNSVPDKPLEKVQQGKRIFKDLCRQYAKLDKNVFVDKLVEFLKNDYRHEGDPLGSICVSMPETNYGTRTHTIVLVAKSGLVDFIEVTMVDPIDCSKPLWKTSKYNFNIQ